MNRNLERENNSGQEKRKLPSGTGYQFFKNENLIIN